MSLLFVFAVGCFAIVVLTHIAERFHIFPAMGWGLPNRLGHYLDLASAILSTASFMVGLVLAMATRL